MTMTMKDIFPCVGANGFVTSFVLSAESVVVLHTHHVVGGMLASS